MGVSNSGKRLQLSTVESHRDRHHVCSRYPNSIKIQVNFCRELNTYYFTVLWQFHVVLKTVGLTARLYANAYNLRPNCSLNSRTYKQVPLIPTQDKAMLYFRIIANSPTVTRHINYTIGHRCVGLHIIEQKRDTLELIGPTTDKHTLLPFLSRN